VSKSTIESMMNDSDRWSLNDIDDQAAINQHGAAHAQASGAAGEGQTVVEIDEGSAPPEAVAKQESRLEGKKKGELSKKKKAAVLVGGIVAVTVIAAVVAQGPGTSAPRTLPPPPEQPAQAVASQFTPPPAPSAPEMPTPAGQPGEASASSQATPIEASTPSPSAVSDASPAGQALGAASPSASVPAGAPAAAQPVTAAPAPASTPVAAPSVAPQDSSRDDAAKKLAAMEEENRRLKQELQRVQRAAVPARGVYGSDVYRIYDDGIVLIAASGERVPVAIGEATRRYGVLKKTNPADNSFVTDRGEFRAARTH
jgi:hypothetical protein